MDTQEAQAIINNSKDTESDKYKEAKAFLESQQVKGKTEKELKAEERKRKEEATREWMVNRPDVQNAVRRSQIANPAVGVVDRVAGNVTGRNEDLFDPFALKAKDLNPDGSIAEKDLRVGGETTGNFIGAESSEGGKGSSGGNSSSASSGKLDGATQSFLDKNNAIANTQEDKEYARQEEELGKRWEARMKNIDKMSDSMKNIDDHLIDQLPTFMWRRYQNGEFGDPKSSDAKLRLAYFAINNVVSKLKMVANADAIARGQGQIFGNTESAYDQYQASNLAQGLENRWNKYKQETQSAIDLAKKEGMDEQDLQSSIAKISSNNRLQTTFNMMNENQKVYTLQVLSKIGNEIGNMNNKDFVNTLIGFATSGDNLSWQEAAELLIARFGKDAMGAIKAANEEGATEGASETTAGVGGTITKTKLSDGTEITTSGKLGGMTDEDYTKLETKATDLIKKYYSGEINKETFEKDYGALYNMMKSHPIYNKKKSIKSVKDVYKENKPYEAKEIFGEKKYKDGLKSVEYFEKDPSLFEYFKNTENPNYLEAKEKSKNIKDVKAYNKALEHYNKLKDTKDGKGLTLVSKW